MALETFEARLKAKSTAAGAPLSSVRLKALAAKLNAKHPDLTEETDHDAQIDNLYEATDFKEMKTFDDYQRAKAAKEKKDKEQQRSESASDDDGESQQQDSNKPPAEMPAWFKPFADELTTLRKEKTQASIADMVKAHEKIKGIPALFLKGRSQPDKAENVDTWADDVAADWEEFQKENPIQQGGGGNQQQQRQRHQPQRASAPPDKAKSKEELDALIGNI